MADGIKARIGGTWKDLTPSIKIASAWKSPDAVHVRVGGVWKQVWTGVTVTVTARTNQAFEFGSNAQATMIWNADGTRDDKDNTSSAVQVLSATDWIIPNGEASSSYRIRHTSESGDTTAFQPYGTINTWYAISGSRSYYIIDTTPTVGGKSCTFNIEIDDGSGTALDSGSQTVTADREDF